MRRASSSNVRGETIFEAIGIAAVSCTLLLVVVLLFMLMNQAGSFQRNVEAADDQIVDAIECTSGLLPEKRNQVLAHLDKAREELALATSEIGPKK